ncbi:Protein YLS9 [Melia azedarach]|uniref:Protein YLS9 n=1 Tax=Melia azedarach TaxID=155640 RepID=A0ACC1X394_MELAZ|nr:Protein YLS9 [Melia azedarach]
MNSNNSNIIDTGTKSGQSSADSIPEPPPPTRQCLEPQPPSGYPPAPPTPASPQQEAIIGYPPAMGYPPGYPNTFNQSPYHHQPPPGMYYPTQQYRRRPETSPGGVLLTMMMLMFFAFTFAVITWLVVRPKFPVFHVESLAVSDFNVSTDNFTSTWEGNIAIENKNLGANIHLERIQSFIFYNSDDLIISSYLENPGRDISVRSYGKGTIPIKLSTSDVKQPVPPPDKRVMEEMRMRRQTGVMPFALKAIAWTEVETGIFSTNAKHIQIRILCEDLKVEFERDTGNGKLSDRSKNCEVEI